MPSTTHDGWGARDDLPYGRVAGGHAHVQAATLAVAVVDSEIYAVRTIIPGLIHHETYHSMPEVPVGMLPEKKS